LAFSREGPLDMRYDQSRGPTAAELVNTLSVRELAEIIRDYGEEPHGVSHRIAEKLVRERGAEPIVTTERFARIVREAIGRSRSGKIDAATRTFQALRIAVNDELSALDALLEHVERAARALRLPGSSGGWLRQGARVGIISFHSLEDRRVKRSFAGLVEQQAAVALTNKPVEADETEQRANPRSRSARFRAIWIGP
jgi:16S rRNA (cytosine1402-N4)-methyltransferase